MNGLTYSTKRRVFMSETSHELQTRSDRHGGRTCDPAVPRAHPATRILSLGSLRHCKGCMATFGASEGASIDRKNIRLLKRSQQNTTPQQQWHRILHRARNTNRHRERNKTKNRRRDSPRCAHGVATSCLAKKSQRLPSIRRGLQFSNCLSSNAIARNPKHDDS